MGRFLAQRLQRYGSFKFKTFVWEITEKALLASLLCFRQDQMPITSRQMGIWGEHYIL